MKYAIIGMVALVALALTLGFAYPEFTEHERTLTVQSKLIDIAGGENGGSHYVVRGNDGQILELERAWYMFDHNIDELWFETTEGRTISYNCFGWQIPEFYWYSVCYEITNIKEAESQ